MKTLAINTASSQSAIVLIENGEVISEITWLSDNDEAEKLMPAINDLLDGDFKQVDKVLVVSGPGSFTGLRIGVATANTFAYLQDIPLYAINAFEYWWRANDIVHQSRDNQAALLIYAGSGGVYISYGEVGTLFKLEDASRELADKAITKIFGDISQEQKKHFDHLEFIQPSKDFASVAASFDLNKMKSVKLVQPLYIKGPGITSSKKKIFN